MEVSINQLPTKKNLDMHSKVIDEALQKIEEVSNGLSMHREQYKLCERTSHRPKSVQAEPSNINLGRFNRFRGPWDSSYKNSIRTREDAEQYYAELRGGTGSDKEEDDANIPGSLLGPPVPAAQPIAQPPIPPPGLPGVPSPPPVSLAPTSLPERSR
ncbi:hypothetical protein BDD12DRAFT_886736 [Trichophaea hybrida]|nr:hypothetical protein BDD12DRAFT_886736 [Trichophaea hybrida]